MLNNFFKIVTQVFGELCNEKQTTSIRKQNIAEVTFKDFSISIYYCPYEYDLEMNYCKKGKELILDQVLQELGCSSSQLPQFKYISNEEVMENYLSEYIILINLYFKDLSKYQLR